MFYIVQTITTDMLVINTVIITFLYIYMCNLFRKNKFVVISRLINVSRLPLIAMAVAGYVVSLCL